MPIVFWVDGGEGFGEGTVVIEVEESGPSQAYYISRLNAIPFGLIGAASGYWWIDSLLYSNPIQKPITKGINMYSIYLYIFNN